jgi:hypothetical protein
MVELLASVDAQDAAEHALPGEEICGRKGLSENSARGADADGQAPQMTVTSSCWSSESGPTPAAARTWLTT